jgi:hypothetical protein
MGSKIIDAVWTKSYTLIWSSAELGKPVYKNLHIPQKFCRAKFGWSNLALAYHIISGKKDLAINLATEVVGIELVLVSMTAYNIGNEDAGWMRCKCWWELWIGLGML